ncbi:MAG: hypothetical protein ACR2P7_03360 [bacterium]
MKSQSSTVDSSSADSRFGHAVIAALCALCFSFVAVADDSIAPIDNLDHLLSAYQSQGLQVERLGATWETQRGTLRVGGDWSNFGARAASPFDHARSAGQITWRSRNGFSIALEEPVGGAANPDRGDGAINDDIESLQALTDGSPNLVLSWQGGLAEEAGAYKVSALGRRLDLNGAHNGVEVDDRALGWGLNLAGGWRFGDLFAALSVTLGNGIDSLLLQRFGSDVAVSPSGEVETLESLSILPSLNYSLGQNADLHVVLGRYQARDETAIGIDTLDTINLGYTWSPWPSAKIGIEVVGKNVQGTIDDGDSAEVKIGAEKRF